MDSHKKKSKVLIKTLYPGEFCLSHDRLSQFESEEYQFSKENYPPKVTILSNGKRVVRNGNHRIYSEIQKGKKYVHVRLRKPLNEAENKFLLRTIEIIEVTNQKGFLNMVLCETKEDCQDLTMQIEQLFRRQQIKHAFLSSCRDLKKKKED